MTAPLADRVRARAHREVVRRRYRKHTTAARTTTTNLSLRPLLGAFELPPAPPALAATAGRYVDGWFDLLGSGWRPFTEWHTDPLSGHRWDPTTWHTDLDITPRPGVDVKLPWELGRLQHLPQLALAHRYAAQGAPGFADPERYRAAVEDHLVDFVTHNPPGRGVQWGCAMDVAIRVANVLLALDILATGDSGVSPHVQPLVAASVAAHARFIVANLEWTRTGRTNHYLADVCGLLWAAAHLEGAPEADSWLCLAARELQAETRRQFDRDGAGTEGSTSYHRLSAEMVVWTTAVLLALPEDRVRSLAPRTADVADVPRPLRAQPLAPEDVLVSATHLRRVARMPDVTTATTTDGNHVALIGDNDSGRFVRPQPSFQALPVGEVVARYRNLDGYAFLAPDDVYWWEDTADHRHLRGSVDGLLGSAGGDADSVLVHAYARRSPAPPRRASSVTVRVGGARPTVEGDVRQTLVVPGGDDLLDGLETQAFVPFGLYVWRSRRLFLAVRCGPVGQEGLGGHDHRDQLALELWVDGVPWFRDPGSVTYTRDPDLRNAYRSAGAHAGPNDERPEDWEGAGGLFTLGQLAVPGVPRWYGPTGFVGERAGTDGPAVRSVSLLPDRIEIVDLLPEGRPGQAVLRSAAEAARTVPRPVPFSPGYGWQEREVAAP